MTTIDETRSPIPEALNPWLNGRMIWPPTRAPTGNRLRAEAAMNERRFAVSGASRSRSDSHRHADIPLGSGPAQTRNR